jgi:hypothetical protein
VINTEKPQKRNAKEEVMSYSWHPSIHFKGMRIKTAAISKGINY